MPPAFVPSLPTPPWYRTKKGVLIIAAVVLLCIVIAGSAWYYSVFKINAQYRAVQSAFNNNDLAGALQKADAILASNPKDVQALIAKSFILSQEGSLQFKEKELGGEAATVAQAAIAINPASSEAWRALGYANEIQQNYTEAHTDYQKAISLNPKSESAIFDDAHAYDLEGNLAAAEKGYRAALALDASLPQVHAGLGRILILKGDVKGALAEYALAYKQATNAHDKAEASYMMGTVSLSLKDTATAEKNMTDATKLDPNYALGWYGLGKVQISEGVATSTKLSQDQRISLMQLGLNNYSKAIAINPNQSVVYLDIAIAQGTILRKPTLALATLATAAAAVPNDRTLNISAKEAMLTQIQAVRTLIGKQK
ncbi:MAG: hypothetical protein JWL88_70 [Parcubacteria group bacterium]|nr:hypothetical protein [Parcubacteria group bacterium]